MKKHISGLIVIQSATILSSYFSDDHKARSHFIWKYSPPGHTKMAMLFRSFKKNQLISLFKCFQQQQQILLFSKHRVTIGEMPSKPNDEILKPMSLETANSKQLLHDRIYKVIERFKQEEGDTGSAAVQIAVMTERIQNLARHFAGNKKDFGSRRGFQVGNVLIYFMTSIKFYY